MKLTTEEMRVDQKMSNWVILIAWNLQKQKSFDNFIIISIIINCTMLALDV